MPAWACLAAPPNHVCQPTIPCPSCSTASPAAAAGPGIEPHLCRLPKCAPGCNGILRRWRLSQVRCSGAVPWGSTSRTEKNKQYPKRDGSWHPT